MKHRARYALLLPFANLSKRKRVENFHKYSERLGPDNHNTTYLMDFECIDSAMENNFTNKRTIIMGKIYLNKREKKIIESQLT